MEVGEKAEEAHSPLIKAAEKRGPPVVARLPAIPGPISPPPMDSNRLLPSTTEGMDGEEGTIPAAEDTGMAKGTPRPCVSGLPPSELSSEPPLPLLRRAGPRSSSEGCPPLLLW